MVYYRKDGRIYIYEAGVGNIASANTGKPLDVWRNVRVTAQGSSIEVWVDGELQISHEDGTYSSGYMGFRMAT